ncbi:MAG TPA: CHAT domain-containing protein, partial [Pseudomonadota bacterium]|nr:CHAT domain-containing protein [Pseudomonadota bacterium]
MQPLIITLEFARALKAEDPYEFVFAPQEYRLRRPGGGIETASLAWNQALREDLAALRAPRRDPLLPQRIGELLRSFVTPLGWEEYAGQILEAVRQGRRVLLSIRSAAAELYSLPWELLTIKATGQHVGELPAVLLRYEWPETTTTPEQPLPRQGHGRILLAWSAASGAVPAVEHQRAIESACQAGGITFYAARDVLSQVSMGRLQAALAEAKKSNQPISVLHLLAHGGALGNTFGLVLDGESTDDDSVIVDAGQLRRLLAPYADMVRLVVLSACDSANAGALGNALGSVAQTLHRAGMASVVASRYPLSVVGSVRLAEALYRGLAVGPDSLESALLAARDGLAKDAAQNDWSSLQLYARAADGEDTRPLRFRPYKGLASFGVSDQRFFHGREAVTQSLRQRFGALSQTPDALRLLAVLGPSGSGKSSVARAGLLASLLRAPWPGPPPIRLAVLRPGERPIDSLAKSLLPLRAADAQNDLTTLLRDPSAEGLSRVASSLPEIQTSPLVVFVDQFEELYTLCKDDAERDAFVGLLMHAAQDPSRQVAVVLTLRTDFFGETQQRHPELNRVIGAQHELVTAMSPAELAVAIAKPAEQVGRPMDEAIVELLLSEVRGKAGALPLLAFALSRIWEGMERGEEPSATLQQIGGVGGALAGEAQKIYQSLSVSEQATARRALSRMVRLGEGTKDTRRLAPISELCGRGETEASVLSVLRQFATENVRLVTLSGEGNETGAEFTHEALFEHWAELRTWINQSRSDRGLLDRALTAARLWIKDGRPSGRLWRSPDLDLLREYQRRKPEDFGPLAEEFLAAAERRRKTEWALRLGAVVAVVSALLIAAGVYLVKQQELTQKERQRT